MYLAILWRGVYEMFRKFILQVFCMFMLSLPLSVFAQEEEPSLQIRVNGEAVNFKYDQPYINKGEFRPDGLPVVFVPVKAVASQIGMDIVNVKSGKLTFQYGTGRSATIPIWNDDSDWDHYVPLHLLCEILEIDLSYNESTNTYDISREIPVEDIYGFKIKYDRYTVFKRTETGLSVSRGPYDEYGNGYAQLTLSIYDLDSITKAELNAQIGQIEEILKQKIHPKTLNSIMSYVKKGDYDQLKIFNDSNYQVFVSTNVTTIGVTVFKRPVPTKITAETVHGFKISYDKSSRYTKNRLTIMKGPFLYSDYEKQGRLLIIGIAYEEKVTNISSQYAEAGAILKQHVDNKVVNAVIEQAKVVRKNSLNGQATSPKVFTTSAYLITVSGGPHRGIEITIERAEK